MVDLYIFDLDDTLRATHSGKFAPEDIEDQYPLKNVTSVLSNLHRQRHIMVAASNQSDVSFGVLSEHDAWCSAIYFNMMIGNMLDNIKLGLHHPDGELRGRFKPRSKPSPAMLLEFMDDYKGRYREVWMIGNAYVDREAAKAANVSFKWAHDFFKWGRSDYVKIKNEGYFWRG